MKDESIILERVVVEVNTNNINTANHLKDNLGSFLSSDVFPAIEKQMEKMMHNLPTDIVRINHLSIDISDADAHNFKKIKSDITDQITKQLQDIVFSPSNDNTNVQLVTKALGKFEILIFFLEKGYLPWHSHPSKSLKFNAKYIKEVSKTEGFNTTIIRKLQVPNIVKRLINQFTNGDVIAVLQSTFVAQEVSLLTPILKDLENFEHEDRMMIWKIVIQYLIDSNINSIEGHLLQYYVDIMNRDDKKYIARIQLILEQLYDKLPIVNQKSLKWSIENSNKFLQTSKDDFISKRKTYPLDDKNRLDKKNLPKESKNISSISNTPIEQESKGTIDRIKNQKEQKDLSINEKSQALYVDNAGLILLHPYISRFFRNCDLLDENNLLVDKVLSAHLLHYLATGKEQQLESDMVFSKFLCGIPTHESIQKDVKLSLELKEKSTSLLKVVIKNWPAIKNASTALLQNEFLQRKGKLDFTKKNPILLIERKTQDILLDKLSWNLSMCKLPWMDKLIIINW